MDKRVQLQTELLKTIKMYEESYSTALKYLKASEGPVNLMHPLVDSLKFYKKRIKELREALRSY